MDPVPSCSKCAINKRHLIHLKECLKLTEEELKTSEEKLKICEEKLNTSEEKLKSCEEKLKTSEDDKKTLREKVDHISSFRVQYQECFSNVSNCVKVEKLREELRKMHEECWQFIGKVMESAKDYAQLKKKTEENEAFVKNLQKLLNSKDIENVGLYLLTGQLEHENNKYKSSVASLEREVQELSSQLSAKKSTARTSKTIKSSKAVRLAKRLLKFGKLGSKDRKWLKTVTKGQENSNEDDFTDNEETSKDGSGRPRNNVCTTTAPRVQNNFFLNVPSPDEGLGLSPSPPINQHSQLEQSQDNSCLNLQFGQTVASRIMAEHAEKNTDIFEPFSGEDSVDYMSTTYYHTNIAKESSQRTVPGNVVCNGTSNIMCEKTVSNVSTVNCKAIKEGRCETTFKECGKRLLPNSVGCTGESTGEEHPAMIHGITDKSVATCNVVCAGKIGKEQPVEGGKTNVDDGDVCGSKNKKNRVDDDNLRASVVACSENEMNTVDGQENDDEHMVDDEDDDDDDDLYNVQSDVKKTVSSSCEMTADRSSEECNMVKVGGNLCNGMNSGYRIGGVAGGFEELPPRLNECRNANIDQVAKNYWQKNERKHHLKAKHQQKQKTLKEKMYTRKPETSQQGNLICCDHLNNNNNNNNNSEMIGLLLFNNSNDPLITTNNSKNWLLDKLSDNFNNKKSQLTIACIDCLHKLCTEKKMVKPKESFMETQVESSHTVGDTADISSMLMDMHSEDDQNRMKQKTKQIIKNNKRKRCIQEVKHFVKKRKLISGRGKFNWSVTEYPVLETKDNQDERNILKSVDEEKKQKQSSGQFQASFCSQLPTLLIQFQSSAPCEVTGQEQPFVHLQLPVLVKPLNQSQFLPCKGVKDESQSSATNEIRDQKQLCVVSQAKVQLQSSAPCEMLSQSQSAPLSEQSQPLCTSGKTSSQLQCLSSAKLQEATPCEVLNQTQASGVSYASHEPLLGQQSPVPCEVLSQLQSELSTQSQFLSAPSKTSSQLQCLSSAQLQEAMPCEVLNQTQASDASYASREPLLDQQLSSTIVTDEPLDQSQQSPSCLVSHSGTDETRVHDVSLAGDAEVHAAVFEDIVLSEEKSETCDVDNSDIEIPVTSKITDSCVDVDTLGEDLPDFDLLDEDLIGNLSQPLLNGRYLGKEGVTENSFHTQNTEAPVSDLFVSDAQDGRKTQEESNNIDKDYSVHDILVPSGKSEQLTSSGKQPHTAVCESTQVEQLIITNHLQTIDINSDCTSRTLSECAENFDIVNMPVILQDYNSVSNSVHMTDYEKSMAPGSRMFKTVPVISEETTDLGSSIETMVEDHSAMILIEQEGGGTAAEPEIQQNITAITRGEKATDNITETKKSSNRVIRKIETSLSSPSGEKNIQTRSIAKQISQGKYGIPDEDGHTKGCKKKIVKSKSQSVSCVESDSEQRIITRSLKKSIAGNKHSGYDSVTDKHKINISQREKKSKSNVCSDALKLINRDVCRIVSRAKNLRRGDQKSVDSHILKMNMKVEEMTATPLKFDSYPIVLDGESEFISSAKMKISSDDKQAGITSSPLTQNHISQTNVEDITENQTQQPFSMPLLDNFDIHNSIAQQMCTTSKTPTKECVTGTDVNSVEETQHQLSATPVLDEITDSVGTITSGHTLNTTDVGLNKACANDVDQLISDSPSFDGCNSCIRDGVAVGEDMESNVLPTTNKWSDQSTIHSNSEKQKKSSSMMMQEATMGTRNDNCASTVGKKQCVNDSKIFETQTQECTQHHFETENNRQKQGSSSAPNKISDGKRVSIKYSSVQETGKLFNKSGKSNSTLLPNQNKTRLQNQNAFNSGSTISGTVIQNEIRKDGIVKTVNSSETSLQVTSSSDKRPQKKLSHTIKKRSSHNVQNISADLEKNSLATDKQCKRFENKQPRADELTYDNYGQFVPTEPNVFGIAKGASVTVDDLLCIDLATSSSSDSESLPEETIGKHSNSSIVSKMSAKTEYLCKEIQLNKKSLNKLWNQMEKNNEPDLVNKTELGGKKESVCIDLLDSDSMDSVSTSNVSVIGGTQSITAKKVSEDIALPCMKESINLCPVKGDVNKMCNPVRIKKTRTSRVVDNVKLKKNGPNKSDTSLMRIDRSSRLLAGENTENQNRSLSTLCTTNNNFKNKTVCSESSKKCSEEEDELDNIFNEFKCPSLITPFTEKNITDSMLVQDAKEIFKKPKFVRTPKIYQSENDSESDQSVENSSNLQIDVNGSQATRDNDLSDSSTICSLQNDDDTCQGYGVYKQKQLGSNTITADKNRESNIVNNKENSRLEAIIEEKTADKNYEANTVKNKESSRLEAIIEEKTDKMTELVRVTRNVSALPSSESVIQNKHTLPPIVIRPVIKKVNCDTENKKSVKMPRLSVACINVTDQMNLCTKKHNDISMTGEGKIKTDVDNQPSVTEVCQQSHAPVEIKQQSVSHDTNRPSIENNAVEKVSLLSQVVGMDSNQMVGANTSDCPAIIKHFSFYNSDGFVKNKDVELSDDEHKFNELFIDDVPLLKCSEESENDDENDIEELSKYLVPCDSNVLAKAYEFHRCDIYKPKELVKQETQKKMSDIKIATEKAKLVNSELMKLVSCSKEDETQTLQTVFHSIKDHSKQAVADGTVLVLLDDPVSTLSTYEMRKQSLKRLQLPPPTVSRKKQLLLCLFNMLRSKEVFENDLFLCVGMKITKELFSSKNMSIMSAASLVQFYTLMYRMVGDYWNVNALMYNLLCGLKNRSHTLIFEVVLMWPRILIPACEIRTIRNNLIYTAMMHCIMNFSIPKDSALMRVVQLKMYLKVRYGYNLGEYTSEEILQLLIDRLAENDCKYALMLLFKRNKAEWNQTKSIPALHKAIEKSWNTNEAAALSAIWLLGVVCRILPPTAKNEIGSTFEFLKSCLFHVKGTPRLQEEIVIAFAHMQRLDKKSCIKILTQWKPKHRSVSVRVLNYMKPLICSCHPSLWNAYFSKIDEIDKELKKDRMDYFIQEDYDNAVDRILLQM